MEDRTRSDLENIIWYQWPKDRPRPTAEEMLRAQERYAKECEKDVNQGYMGDYLCGLDFVMATYNIECWIHLFDD